MSTRAPPPLTDGFDRTISYLRVSVTDRCDLRCLYCMAEAPDFLPKADLLTFEELDRLCAMFITQGVRRLRVTGGEPLIRRGVIDFIAGLTRHVRSGALDEVTLTTNGTRLAEYAEALAALGIRRINVSLDTLNRDTFARITRRDRFAQVMQGIEAARAAGLTVKINTVALRRDNARDLPDLIRWAHENCMDIALIETMPLGEVDEDRSDQFLSLSEVRRDLESFWTLANTSGPGSGPARYVRVRETGGKLGFITPLSHNFCATCNRVRLTCTGQLFLCLGHEDGIDFRSAMRSGATDAELADMMRDSLARKPEAHDFSLAADSKPALTRFMSATGG